MENIEFKKSSPWRISPVNLVTFTGEILHRKIHFLCSVRIKSRACYYFDDIIKLEDFNLDNISIDEKLQENVLIYVISYKTLIDPKSLRIRLNKIDGCFRIYDGARYLTLFGSEEYEAI